MYKNQMNCDHAGLLILVKELIYVRLMYLLMMKIIYSLKIILTITFN